MFEHLDDPNQVLPGRRELARVLRRADVMRSRRRWLAAVSACSILLAGSIGLFVGRASNDALAATTTAFRFNSLKSPLNVGTPVPSTDLVDVVFANAQDGFAMALHQRSFVLAASTDGGASWHVRNAHLPPGFGVPAGYGGQFEFVGFTGFLWGGTDTGSAPLWVTEDDGATWRKADLGPYVYDVSAIGSNVWALSGSCAQNTAAGLQACSLALDQSTDGGQTWTSVQQVPEPGPATGFAPTPTVELARITRDRAYVLAASGNAATAIYWALSYTADSGATWVSRPVPCTQEFNLGVEIAASGTNDLWLLCGGEAGAGNQPKQVFRSGSGGRTWALVSSDPGVGTPPLPPQPPSPPDAIPLGGYVSPYSVGHHNLAVASPKTAWLYPFRAGLYATRNGGLTWTGVPALGISGFGAGGSGNITFASPTLGWICEYGVGLWHTTDGVHWFPLQS
jgi:hypothetical protein